MSKIEQNPIIEEVLSEIESALGDSKGILSHQRRLAFSLSLGAVELIEEYLKRKSLLRPGAKINHLWLKKKKENVIKLISEQVISPLEELNNFDSILEKTYKIEKERNVLAYGKIASEKILRELIVVFLELKKEVENA